MDYQQAVAYIDSYTDYEKTPVPHAAANYDLRRVDELLARLDDPHRKAKSAHITGTKGKGSTAAMIASALSFSGYTTGLYTSPHLHTINERIRIDGRLITDDEFAVVITRLLPEAEEVNRKATYGQLTTFELLTALAFAYFAENGVAFQVLEVGLGGTYDATNVIYPEVAILTTIGYDHMEILGHTLREIATEKAGIIKPGCVVITSPQAEEAEIVIRDACFRQKAKLVSVGREVSWQNLGFDTERQRLRVDGRLDSYDLAIPLLGEHQLVNAATAVAALEVLAERGFAISKDSVINGLSQVHWPGRFQILNRSPVVVVDGAHNSDSARRLRETLEKYLAYDRAFLVIGASSDKDIAAIVDELHPAFANVIATRSKHPRAMSLERIVAEFARRGTAAEVAKDVPAALARALDVAGPRDVVCVTGSLFVVAEALDEAQRLKLAKSTPKC
ncbi:MAG: bifunctional folylpolyglutamate synthase/dihydrofolate synthase [Chloroflexi bacterium]|nr:bifunctional folylpolyglutamate synthase/dihydrofolate synthase [Chloroflexota bacterium]